MLESEADARMIGYGAMLMESFVAVLALIAISTAKTPRKPRKDNLIFLPLACDTVVSVGIRYFDFFIDPTKPGPVSDPSSCIMKSTLSPFGVQSSLILSSLAL